MLTEEILADPAWFPDRLDVTNRLVRLVRTNHQTLSASAFVDGRTPLSDETGRVEVIALDQFVSALLGKRRPMRWVFHQSFCGSTLIGRILTIKHHALCLREPQILVDMCNWRLNLADGELPLYRATLHAVLAKLAQPWEHDESVVMKPSNWITPIVAEIWDSQGGDRATIVSAAVQTFLVAVIRGGRPRLSYTLRYYQQLAIARPDLSKIANAVLGSVPDKDPMARAVQLVAVAYWMQEHILADGCRLAGLALQRTQSCFPEFLNDVKGTIDTIVARLALDVPAHHIVKSIDYHVSRHSKNSSGANEIDSEAAMNRQILEIHAKAIRAGLHIFEELRSVGPDL